MQKSFSTPYTKLIAGIVCFCLVTACSAPDVGRLFEQYMWKNRVVLVFTPQFENANYKAQLQEVLAHLTALKERDVVVWTLENNSRVSVNQEHKPQLPTRPFYKHFKVDPDQFSLVLLGKDGTEKLRKNSVLSMKELFSTIDSMPMRQREIQDRKKRK